MAVLIVAAAVLVYANSLRVPFVLDDPTTILQNPSIRHLSSLGQVLFPPPEIYSAGRPLLNLSFALNYATGGTAVGGYHAVNAVIHTLAALALFGLVRRTLARPHNDGALRHAAAALALLVSLVWLAHPVQTASVTYVSQRAESLMGLFYLLTLYAFVRAATDQNKTWFAVSVAACACGMATKEVMVTAPILTLLYDRQFVSGTFRDAWRRHRRFYFALAATWLVLLALMLSSQINQRGIGLGHSLGRFDYLRIETRALLHYLRVSLWPEPLIFDFGPQLAVPAGAELIGRGLAIMLLLAGSVVALWRGRAIGFFGIAFFLLLAPSSSFVPVAGQPIAENRVYLPLAIIATAAVVGLFSILGKRAVILTTAALLSLAWTAHQRNEVYRDEITLWTDTVQKQPLNSRAWVMLSVAQIAAGQQATAIATLLAALQHLPNTPELHNNVGIYLCQSGRTAEGVAHLREAVRLNPRYVSAHLSLGQLLFQANDFAAAAEPFAAVVALEPQNVEARNWLGVALARLGRTADAIAQFEAILKIRPDFEQARANLNAVRAQR
jgi:Tfp pilus assembly protein PilF